jgi:hypothetical protein
MMEFTVLCIRLSHDGETSSCCYLKRFIAEYTVDVREGISIHGYQWELVESGVMFYVIIVFLLLGSIFLNSESAFHRQIRILRIQDGSLMTTLTLELP